jgi:hypothetical protein
MVTPLPNALAWALAAIASIQFSHIVNRALDPTPPGGARHRLRSSILGLGVYAGWNGVVTNRHLRPCHLRPQAMLVGQRSSAGARPQRDGQENEAAAKSAALKSF